MFLEQTLSYPDGKFKIFERISPAFAPRPPGGDTVPVTIARLDSVQVQFGRTPVLVGIDLAIDEGERIGLSGPNGSGKSTLLAVLATLLTPTAGDGEVLGARLGTPGVRSVRPRIGWVGHSPGLYDELTLGENLAHLARLAGIPAAEADRALEMVGLAGASDRRAAVCSNGMRRRADLARLLMTRPTLVLMDEADTGLDPDAALIVDAVVTSALARGGAAVIVSHDRIGLAGKVDRLVDIEDGSLRG